MGTVARFPALAFGRCPTREGEQAARGVDGDDGRRPGQVVAGGAGGGGGVAVALGVQAGLRVRVPDGGADRGTGGGPF
ncbi:hypothetical protein GCM10010524_12240 [Streptomyces mexicanus]